MFGWGVFFSTYLLGTPGCHFSSVFRLQNGFLDILRYVMEFCRVCVCVRVEAVRLGGGRGGVGCMILA